MRLRQAVVAARDLDAVSERLRAELGLGEPFADEAVGYFGLRNAVFALGDTFLEVVSPVREATAAGRLLERRGGDCGYMLMFQVPSLALARERAAAVGIREVFAVELPDMHEVHLHPADMGAAIVSLSEPRPPAGWRWGGPRWQERAAALRVVGAAVAVPQPRELLERWEAILGTPAPVEAVSDAAGRAGLIRIVLEGPVDGPRSVDLGAVRLVVEPEAAESARMGARSQ